MNLKENRDKNQPRSLTPSSDGKSIKTFEEALILLDSVLKKERLTDLQELVFQQTWEGRTYPEIAEAFGYETDYIKYVGFQLWQLFSKAFGEKVNKNNFRTVLRRHVQSSVALGDPQPTQRLTVLPDRSLHQDWGEAIDVSVFYGRIEELATLKQWIVPEASEALLKTCRLVTLVGLGGIGKTVLAAKLAQQIQDQFEFLIWRSLANAPRLEETLASLIQFLSHQQETVPATPETQVSQLMGYLQAHRCLLILDNTEAILQSGDHAGRYRARYEGYGQLFRSIGETAHQSCLVLIGREEPIELAAKAGKTFPIRSFQLEGLREASGRAIFQAKGLFGSEGKWLDLIQYYRGHPLVLKVVATTIQKVFDGSPSKFLEQGAFVFGEIGQLLDQHFHRLSALEKQIMYWLAVHRTPISPAKLQQIAPQVTQCQLLEALESLQRRSLVEKAIPALVGKQSTAITQQPMVMAYMIERLVEQVSQEITSEPLAALVRHALIKTSTKE